MIGRAGSLLLWGTEGSREQKIPNNRLRGDINQISLEIIGHTQNTHMHWVFWGVLELWHPSLQVNDIRPHWEPKHAKMITRVEM